jgi:hypothetical protein
MNRRFIHQQHLRLDPEKYILRHIRRIAKRAGIRLDISPRGCTLHPAQLAASPALRAEDDGHPSSSNTPHWRDQRIALTPTSSRGGGDTRRPALIAQARAPPGCLLPIADCLSAPARLRPPLRA